nr:NADH dehydrogenase subunit 6 [Tillus discoidalis]WIL79910.1 NADH dehydrogenase subunit 6 [Opilo sinensis]
MKFLIMASFFISMSILFLTHPMSLGFTLLSQTILTSLIISFLNFNFWFSYILFLIMIGGMLILFIYMTSIASNEKFLFSNFLFGLILLWIIMMMFMHLLDSFYSYNLINNTEIFIKNYNINFNLSINKYFNHPNYYIFYTAIIYLLITLIAVVKISNINQGPLRPKN